MDDERQSGTSGKSRARRGNSTERGPLRAEPPSFPSLPAMFLAQAAGRPGRPFLWQRRAGAWTARTYGDTRREVSEVYRGLRALGLAPGDRIFLLAENRPEWLIADLAILAAGGVTVPAYVTNTAESHRHLLVNTRARGAVVSTPALLRQVLAVAPPELEFVVCLEPPRSIASSGPALHSWDSVRERGRDRPDDLDDAAARLGRGDVACIQHTSGTGGTPRGAVLTHGAILANVEGGWRLLQELNLDADVFLSFLPASHAYEHTAGQFLPIAAGGEIYYLESATQVPTGLLEARPTLLIAVPRLLETMHRRILQELGRRGPLGRGLFQAAQALGRARYARGGRLPLALRPADLLVDRLVRARIRARFGGRLKAIVSGGAPLNPELGLFFQAAGLRVLQGYGLTEAGPVVTCNPPRRPRVETVGPPLPGVEVRIAPDGEILVRGENVMLGYWNDEAATRAAISDGWLHTGDVGALDADGYLAITDRKRDFLKTTGGDMVAPQRVEGTLLLEREIAQAMVLGDRRPHLVALLVPDAETLQGWARARGLPPDPAACGRHPEFRRLYQAAIERANGRLAAPERIRRFLLLAEPFTVENDLLTPTLKLRRSRIVERYRAEVDGLYDGRAGEGPSA